MADIKQKSRYNLRKKEQKKEDKKKEEKNEKNLEYGSESDGDEDDSDYESEEEYEESTDSNEMDEKEYKKFLAKLFPSKFINKKIKEYEEIDKKIDEERKVTKSKSPTKNKIKEKSKDKKLNDNKKSKRDEHSETESEEYEEESEEEIYTKGKNQNFNIVFTIGNPKSKYEDEDYDEDEDEDYDEEESESESEEESSEDEEDEKEKKKNDYTSEDKEILAQFKEMTSKLLEKNKDSKLLNEMKDISEDIEEDMKEEKAKREKKTKKKNLTEFKKCLKEKNMLNDFSYFEKLEPESQLKIIKEVREINNELRVNKPYRFQLLESNIPAQHKACAMKKLNMLRYLEPGAGEYYKMKNWLDTFMRIPFDNYSKIPLQISDGVDKCHEFMENAKNVLDEAVYGLNDAKLQIMQLVGQWITNPDAVGTAIAIKGPPGTGKTTLVREGISKILGRDFAFLALGGATDSSFLEGHGYTYEGSTWGKIVDILVQGKTMNPIIFFDELDKISDSPKGEEITGILTHLTDTSQNQQFHDKFFSEIDFDLSKCLFIFSYNDESRVNPILRDRMYRIQTDGYTDKEKTVIAKTHLLPKIREQVKFKEEDILIDDEVLSHIVNEYTEKEKGVRNFKRCLEIIYTKLNLYRLMKPDSKLFDKEQDIKVEFPMTVTKEVVKKMIKREDNMLAYIHNTMYL
jgi:ATP-dependent Lon protease